MRLEEIKDLKTTLEIDPDEARILAAACRIAGAYCEGSQPTLNPFKEFGSPELMSLLMEACEAMFEAASMAGAAHFALDTRYSKELSLSSIRRCGTGVRFQVRDESEASDAS